ncbi:uncharacterized protein LOC126826585 [Patella vulgata]|uniref:uncharacterized protein LOC126826585 n=1 Tax=Patella vulgata TaxID=6465 RepID=UPI0021802B8F|nr:uncharacterized protein LOC126826585 [Patella vulgata]
MDVIPAFILFLLSIYSQVGPGLGVPLFDPIIEMDENVLHGQRHLLEVTEATTESAPPVDEGFFADVSAFYSDKNNMAMYLVLPVIVLLYGGCSSIYCIAKCRRYLRKRKHQRLSGPEDEEQLTQNEPNNLNQDGGIDNPRHAIANNIDTSSTDVKVGVERENSTPLPWQVPEDVTPSDVKPTSVPPLNRPMIPLEKIQKPGDNQEIPKQNLPETAKPYNGRRFPQIDEPSPIGQHVPVRRVDSDEDLPPTKIFRPPNKDLIEAALRPSPSGRESVSTIAMKDELLARFDAFSTFAMAKKAADILRVNSMGGDKKDYVKPKNKLIFIAE